MSDATQILVDILDNSSNRLGSGPLRALRWRHTAEMDRAGSFECVIDASDPQADQATATRTLRAYGLVGGSRVALGTGIVDQRDVQPQRDGQVEITLGGDDQMRALTWRLVDDLAYGGISPAWHVTVIYGIQATAPGWTFVPAAAPPYEDLYLRFAGESVLAAVRKFAAANGTHFWLSGDKELTFFESFTASGLRALAPPVGGVVGASSTVAWIDDLRLAEESWDVVTRVRPFATGTGRVQLGLAATDRTPPAGYTLDTATNYLIHDTAEAIYGVRARRVDFPEIGPISNTDADLQNAANALFDASLTYLQRHAEPVRLYELRLLQCPAILRPGQTIPVRFRRVVDGVVVLDIDETLLILGATIEADGEGIRTTGLTVATLDRWPMTDVDSVVEQVEQGRVYRAHPQYSPNSYTTSYQKPVDETETATIRFRFGEEVAELAQVVFDFQLLPLESTVKSVGASSATTSSGGSSTPTTSSGGSSTPTTSSGGSSTPTTSSGGSSTPTTSSGGSSTPTSSSGGGTSVSSGSSSEPGVTGANLAAGDPHSHNFTTPAHTHSVTIGDHTHSVTIASHTHDVTIASHTHDVTIASHSHTVTIGSHSHTVTIGSHTHDVTPTIVTTYGIFRESGGNTFALADLEYAVNGGGWAGLNTAASLGSGEYRLDLTGDLMDGDTFRPLQAKNELEIRRKSAGATGKTAMIDGLLSVRNVIQAIVYS